VTEVTEATTAVVVDTDLDLLLHAEVPLQNVSSSRENNTIVAIQTNDSFADGRKRSRSPSPGADRRPEKRQRLDPR
jgi:hypothetical protein